MLGTRWELMGFVVDSLTGCFIFLMLVCLVSQSRLTLCNPLDSSPPGSSVHGIFQTRILAWVVISFFRGSSWPRDQTCVSCIADRFFAGWAIREALTFLTVWQLGSKWEVHEGNKQKLPVSLGLDWKIVSFFAASRFKGRGKQSPSNGRNGKNIQPPWINQHFLDQLFYRTDYLIFVFSLWKYCKITIKGRINERECSHHI